METGVFGSRLRKGAKTGRRRERIAHDPFRSVGNGVVWEAPDGVVWLFYVVRYGETWSTSRVQAKVSRDQAETWSDASMLVLDEGTLVRNRPIVLDDGDYLLPLYHETGHDTESTGPRQLLVLPPLRGRRTRPGPRPGRSGRPEGNIQPAVVELNEHDLVAYCRRGGDYRPETIGYIVRSESHDGGWTWSEGKDSAFPNPNAAVDFLRAQERPAAPGLQPQHEPAHPLCRGSLVRSGPDLARSPRPPDGRQRLRLPDRLPVGRRPDPRRLHLRPPAPW